jgi:integrase
MEGQLIERTTPKDKKLKRRRWQLRVFLGYDSNRKAKYKFETYVGNESGAKDRLRELLVKHGKGQLHQETLMSVAEYLKAWAADALDGTVSLRTAQDYKGTLARYIEPAIGYVKLARLKPLHIQNIYSDMARRGLSSRTIRFTHTVFKKALSKAVKWKYINHNPAEELELPKKVRREMRAMSAEQVQKLLRAAAGTRFEALWQFALDTGMRPEEYLAIRWSDIRDGIARVERAVTRRIHGGGYHFIETKTPQSRRSIPLSRTTIRALERHRKAQLEQRMSAGKAWKDLDLVFANQRGEPLNDNNLLKKYLRPLLEKANLPAAFNLYSLRHTCATLLLLVARESPKIVAERLGHTSITITLDTYSHVLPGMQEAASDALDRLVFTPEKAQNAQ